jgi:hypothetical protein
MVTLGTIFEATKRPMTTWFLAMHLLTQSKNNVSALELKRHLDVLCPAARTIKHKVHAGHGGLRRKLDTNGACGNRRCLPGGERAGARGRGSENKVPIVGTVQTTAEGKPQRVCFKKMRFTRAGIQDWARRPLVPDAEVYSDILPSMKAGLAAETLRYHAIRTGSCRKAVLHPEFHCVNTVLSHLKTAISGTYHAFNFAQYAALPGWSVVPRFNRRIDLSMIFHRLLRTAATRPYPAPAPVLRMTEIHFIIKYLFDWPTGRCHERYP